MLKTFLANLCVLIMKNYFLHFHGILIYLLAEQNYIYYYFNVTYRHADCIDKGLTIGGSLIF